MTVYVVNPNTSEETTARMVAIAAAAVPSLAFRGATAAFGAAMITDEAGLETGARAVEALVGSLPGPVRGVIVAAFGDPGIEAVRAALTCPVVGIGEASFAEAADGGRRFGVATTTPGLVDAIAARVEAMGHGAAFTGTCLTAGDPFALMREPEALLRALAGAVEDCIAAGAERVIIGGGPLAQAAARLRAETGREIVEPLPAAARMMARLLGV